MNDYIKADEIIKTYLRQFDRVSKNNEHLGILSFHTLLGILARDYKINKIDYYDDLRIPTIAFQTSGSGKTPAYTYTRNVAKLLGMKSLATAKMTDASAVGSFIDGEEREGTFKKYDLIMYNEGRDLVASDDPDMRNLRDHMNTVNDPIGNNEIQKELAQSHNTIKYYPKCSFFIVTYLPPKVISEIIFSSGFFPRFLMTYKDVTILDQNKVNQELILSTTKNVNKECIKRLTYTEDKKEKEMFVNDEYYDLILYLRQMKEEIENKNKKDKTILLSEDSAGDIGKFAGKISENLTKERHQLQGNLGPFIPRLISTTLKLSAHHALLEGNDEVLKEDSNYGIKISEICWNDIFKLSDLVTDKRDKSKSDNIYDAIIEGVSNSRIEGISSVLLISKLAEEFELTEKTIRSKIKILINNGEINQSKMSDEINGTCIKRDRLLKLSKYDNK